MVAPVETEPGFRVRTSELLFEETGIHTRFGRTYDIAPDGQRFLVVKQGTETTETYTRPEIVLTQHWFDELSASSPARSHVKR